MVTVVSTANGKLAKRRAIGPGRPHASQLVTCETEPTTAGPNQWLTGWRCDSGQEFADLAVSDKSSGDDRYTLMSDSVMVKALGTVMALGRPRFAAGFECSSI